MSKKKKEKKKVLLKEHGMIYFRRGINGKRVKVQEMYYVKRKVR